MKLYLLSLGAGLLVGVLYNLLGVRSPAPPLVALIGLLGILAGEQAVPFARRAMQGQNVVCTLGDDCAEHGPGRLPGDKTPD